MKNILYAAGLGILMGGVAVFGAMNSKYEAMKQTYETKIVKLEESAKEQVFRGIISTQIADDYINSIRFTNLARKWQANEQRWMKELIEEYLTKTTNSLEDFLPLFEERDKKDMKIWISKKHYSGLQEVKIEDIKKEEEAGNLTRIYPNTIEEQIKSNKSYLELLKTKQFIGGKKVF